MPLSYNLLCNYLFKCTFIKTILKIRKMLGDGSLKLRNYFNVYVVRKVISEVTVTKCFTKMYLQSTILLYISRNLSLSIYMPIDTLLRSLNVDAI